MATENRRLRVAHVIGGLEIGGAELMVERLCLEHRRLGLADSIVVSLTGSGEIGRRLEALGVRVEALGLSSATGLPLAVLRLARLLRDFEAEIVQTWLYHADTVGALATKLAGRGAVVWNIRCTAFGDSRLTRRLVGVNARLSRFLPDSIVCCGEESRRFHAARNYDLSRMTVLPNGFDVKHFTPPARTTRKHGCRFVAIGRDDALKDYATMIEAAAQVAAVEPECSFAVFGRGIPANPRYRKLIADRGLAGRFELHDQIADVREPLAGADVFCSSSRHEGFPNVIAEAMLMELPCVATAAGDSAAIVGDSGLVVAPGNPDALAQAMLHMARLGGRQRQQRGRRARAHILENFEMGHVARLYARHYCAVLANTGH